MIFAGTKVRVLLSDDLGKTFKHIVLAETANDGAEEVTLPNINTSKAVLKVEVIEGVAFALTDYNPKTGGFTIEKDNNLASEPLAFVATTLPQDLNLSCAKEVPTAVMPTTTGGCASVSYRMEEKKTAVLCDNRFTLLRIFTATDGCTTLTHTQTIKVADNIPPTFVGTLPQDITIEEGEPIPLQKSISAEDTCAGAPTVKRSMREELNEEGKRVKIIYQWVARDVCGNEAVHIQTISITPKKIDVMMSQIDVMPTVFGLLNFNYTSKFIGQDVLKEGYQPRAYIATYQDLGYLTPDKLTIISPLRKTTQYSLHKEAEQPSQEYPLFYEQVKENNLNKEQADACIGTYQATAEWLKNKQYNAVKK